MLDDLGRPVPLVYIEDGMPAIVSMSQKLSCIEKLGFRRRLKTNADYLLSGKLICSKCKEPMHEMCIRDSDHPVFQDRERKRSG